MKTQAFLVGAALTALSLAACSKPANSAAGPANPSDSTAASNQTAGAPGATSAVASAPASAPLPGPAFATAMAASDMFEITEAKIAEKKATNPDVKAFARMMITDHTKSTTMLKAAASKAGQPLTPPATLPPDKQAMVDALGQATGADFDRTYMTQQVTAHTQTLQIAQAYASGGDVPALKDFANTVAPIVQTHLDRARALQSSLK